MALPLTIKHLYNLPLASCPEKGAHRASVIRVGAAALLFSLLLSGCTSLLPPLTEPGASDTPANPGTPDQSGGEATLLVTVHAAQASFSVESFRPAERLRVTLEKPRSVTTRTPTLRREVPVGGEPATVRFERIETGRWLVSAEIVDVDGVPMYTGKEEVYVRDGETSVVDVFLDIVPGALEVQIDLGDVCIAVGDEGQCLHDVANRGYLRLAPGPEGKSWNESFDWIPGEQRGTVAVNRLTPGDYEFQVVFYRDTRTVGNMLLEGHWTPFRVEPGRTTTVQWHAQTGALNVSLRVNKPPAPPSDVTAAWTEGGVVLSWSSSPSDNVVQYYVWHKTGPRAELVRVHATPDAGTTTWLHADPAVETCSAPDGGLFYFVTAVNEYGLESVRSEQLNACWLL